MKQISKYHKNPKIISVLFITVLILGFSVLNSLAAQSENTEQALEVSPPTQEVKADPGTTATITATVRNRSQASLPIIARIENFIASGDEGQVALTEEGPWAVSSWTTLTPEEFELKPGASQEVTATISIPRGEAGGRYGSFVFSITGAEANESAASLSQEVASLFLIRLSGDVNEELKLTSIAVPNFSEFGPIPIILNYENNGNVHLRPRGTITIRDMFGRIAGYVHADATNIFPGASRKVPLNWEKKLLIGRFTAEAAIRGGGTNRTELTAVTSFVVFPVRLALILILSGIIVFLLRKRLAKALKALLS